MKAFLERYLRAREAEAKSAGFLSYARQYVGHFLDWLAARGGVNLGSVTRDDVAAYHAALLAYRYKKTKAPEAPWRPLAEQTIRQRLGLVAHFLGWLALERVLLANPAVGLDLRKPGRHLPTNVLNEAEALALVRAPDAETSIGQRDRAILELLYSSGLRRAELVGLDLADLDLGGGTVLVRRGKGGKARLVPFGATAAESLVVYLSKSRPKFLKRPTNALFLAADRCGNTGGRICKGTLWMIVKKAAKKAKIERRVTPHTLRHSLATHLLRGGADVRLVQEILGHAAVTTTEVYTHVEVSDLAEVQARSHPRGRAPARPTPPARLTGPRWRSPRRKPPTP